MFVGEKVCMDDLAKKRAVQSTANKWDSQWVMGQTVSAEHSVILLNSLLFPGDSLILGLSFQPLGTFFVLFVGNNFMDHKPEVIHCNGW